MYHPYLDYLKFFIISTITEESVKLKFVTFCKNQEPQDSTKTTKHLVLRKSTILFLYLLSLIEFGNSFLQTSVLRSQISLSNYKINS